MKMMPAAFARFGLTVVCLCAVAARAEPPATDIAVGKSEILVAQDGGRIIRTSSSRIRTASSAVPGGGGAYIGMGTAEALRRHNEAVGHLMDASPSLECR